MEALPPSGFARRVFAYLIDVVPITLVYVGVACVLYDFDDLFFESVRKPDDPDVRAAFRDKQNWVRDWSMITWLAYGWLAEPSAWQGTLGKKLMGIKVVARSGRPLNSARAAQRNAFKFISTLACGLGFFWMLWSKNKATWHDSVAGARVVLADAPAEPRPTDSTAPGESAPSNPWDEAGLHEVPGRSRAVRGFVSDEHGELAAYSVEWIPGHERAGADFDLVVGPWHEEADTTQRHLVSLRLDFPRDRVRLDLQDAHRRPAADAGFAGRALAIEEVEPDLEEYARSVLGVLLAENPDLAPLARQL